MLDILLEAALRATFIAAAALAALWSLRVRAAAVRHRVWTVVMLAMLALPLAIAWAPDVSLRVLPPTYAEASGTLAPPADSIGVAGLRWSPQRASGSAHAGAFMELASVVACSLFRRRRSVARAARNRDRAREGARARSDRRERRCSRALASQRRSPSVCSSPGSCYRRAGIDGPRRGSPSCSITNAPTWRGAIRSCNGSRWSTAPSSGFTRSPGGSSGTSPRWPKRRATRPCSHVATAPRITRSICSTSRAWRAVGRCRIWWACRCPAARCQPVSRRFSTAASGDPARARPWPAQLRSRRSPRPCSVRSRSRRRESRSPKRQPRRETSSRSTSSRSRTIRSCARPRPSIARSPVRRPQASNAVAQATADYEAARQALLIRVAESYFDVFAAENALALQEAAREALSRQLEQAERRFEVGLIGITDVMEVPGRFRSGGRERAHGAARARRSAGGPARRRR